MILNNFTFSSLFLLCFTWKNYCNCGRRSCGTLQRLSFTLIVLNFVEVRAPQEMTRRENYVIMVHLNLAGNKSIQIYMEPVLKKKLMMMSHYRSYLSMPLLMEYVMIMFSAGQETKLRGR